MKVHIYNKDIFIHGITPTQLAYIKQAYQVEWMISLEGESIKFVDQVDPDEVCSYLNIFEYEKKDFRGNK